MIFELKTPEKGENWSFQIHSSSRKVWKEISLFLYEPVVKEAQPFLRSYIEDWLTIEFWTSDENAILAACVFLENEFSKIDYV